MSDVKGLVQNLVNELGEGYTFSDDPGYPGIKWNGELFLSFFGSVRNGKREWGVLARGWLGMNKPMTNFYTAEKVRMDKEQTFG